MDPLQGVKFASFGFGGWHGMVLTKSGDIGGLAWTLANLVRRI